MIVRILNSYRSVIEYGSSDWDCVIATTHPPKVSARQTDEFQLHQYPQKPHATNYEIDERQQQQQQQQDLTQVPLVDAADVNLTLVKQGQPQPQPLQQHHQLPEDLKLCPETSFEDLVEFDRMSLDLEKGVGNV